MMNAEDHEWLTPPSVQDEHDPAERCGEHRGAGIVDPVLLRSVWLGSVTASTAKASDPIGRLM